MDFKSELKKYGASALSAAVIRNFQIADTLAVGNGINLHTRFQAASISKMVFTIAVLRLVSEGKINLEDEVGPYLNDIPLQGRATVRQILSHTAGFGVHGFDGYRQGERLPTTAQIILGAPPANSPKVVQEYTPGEHWVYSGGGFMVLQKCVENISGIPFADFMEQTVLLPLGMADSAFRQDIRENMADGYTADAVPLPGGHYLMPEQAAAGLWTTAADLARFGLHLQNILRGKAGLIPLALMQQMVTPQHRDILKLENTSCQTGLGCYLKQLYHSSYFGHSGGNYGFLSRANFSLQNGSGCCILINSDAADPLIEKMQDFFIGAGEKRPASLRSRKLQAGPSPGRGGSSQPLVAQPPSSAPAAHHHHPPQEK